jgi:hypothetical protein
MEPINDTQTIPEGQVEPDSTGAAGTTGTTPEGGDGQVVGDVGTSQAHSTASGEEVFFDHGAWQKSLKDLPSEQQESLNAAFKQMQGAFTKRMQGIGKESDKLKSYNAFMENPMGQMQALAAQNGYQLTPMNQAQPTGDANGHPWDTTPPATWQDVESRIVDSAVNKAMQQFQGNLQPIMSNIQNLTTNNIETQLDGLDPNWRVYEDAMKEKLASHPTLVGDVATLYRLSVPQEVLESRATQAAIKRLEDKGKNAHPGVKSTSVKTKPTARKVESFQDAVDSAKEQLARQ